MKTHDKRDYAFGQTILTLRAAIGLTQVQMGNLLGVSARTVTGWEGGSSYPKAEHLKILIELAVQRQIFPTDTAAEDIRRLWKESHQKVLLNERWLATLLSEPQTNAGRRSIGTTADPAHEMVDDSCQREKGNIVSDQETYATVPQTSAETTNDTLFWSPTGEDREDRHEARGYAETAQGHNEATNIYKEQHQHTMRKRYKWLLLGLAALVLLTIIGSVGTFLLHARNQATGQAYPEYLLGHGTLVFSDPLNQAGTSEWNVFGGPQDAHGGWCRFNGGAYHVSDQLTTYFTECPIPMTLSNFAFEVQFTIVQGDCGGITFHDDGHGRFYNFTVCENGIYIISKYTGNTGVGTKRLAWDRSSALRSGLGQQNKLAVVAYGNEMTFYVNEQRVAQIHDGSDTSEQFIKLDASSNSRATEVAYTNARLWRL